MNCDAGTVNDQSKVEISVLVMAYNRLQFLPFALDSLERQTFPKEKFEVILITGFDPYGKVHYPAGLSIKVGICHDENMGALLVRGLQLARGEIICILDDDDLFHEEKLSHVYEMFKRTSNLGFYRNNLDFIDKYGRSRKDPTPSHRKVIAQKHIILTSLNDKDCIVKLWRADAYFNNSSIQFRRCILSRYINYIRRVRFGLDFLLFYLSILSGFDLLADDFQLTHYRIHDTNFSYKTTPLKSYSLLSSSFAFIKKISSGKNNMVRTHASILLNVSKVFLLHQLCINNTLPFRRIFRQFLKDDRDGILIFIRSHRYFSLYALLLLILGCFFGGKKQFLRLVANV